MSRQSPSELACVAKGFDCTWKLAKELHKPVIRKLEKRKIYPSYKDIIYGADLAEMQVLSNVSSIFLAKMHWLFP